MKLRVLKRRFIYAATVTTGTRFVYEARKARKVRSKVEMRFAKWH